ncbi:MAG: hypothetical protein LIO81_06725 [Clostridiales bacterium]|nr:hypothetical protein [Clostridiales bacterium]
MIDLHGMISIPYLKKSRFTGSYSGMRYLLQKQEREETVIEAVIWPEPMNFENTADEKKHSKDFSFNQDGLWEAVGWLNAEHEAGHY